MLAQCHVRGGYATATSCPEPVCAHVFMGTQLLLLGFWVFYGCLSPLTVEPRGCVAERLTQPETFTRWPFTETTEPDASQGWSLG